jgi:hypothetical protein
VTERDARIVWPPPRDDPEEEPSHHAARIADRERGLSVGDVPLDLQADEPPPEGDDDVDAEDGRGFWDRLGRGD